MITPMRVIRLGCIGYGVLACIGVLERVIFSIHQIQFAYMLLTMYDGMKLQLPKL